MNIEHLDHEMRKQRRKRKATYLLVFKLEIFLSFIESSADIAHS